VRPEEFYISLEPCEGIPATVCSSVFLGVNTHYFLQGKNGVDIEVLQSSELSDIIEDGTNVYLTVNMQKSNFFSAETKKSVMREGI
ncbi:MAG: TOBE domain-containing protein, partial [Clostridia bacterium]